VLFLSISIVQALHSHQQSLPTEQSASSSDQTVSDSNHCQLCDYLAHQQEKQSFTVYGIVFLLPVPNPIIFHPYGFVGNYKFTLQGFTNKGPPTFLLIS